jgi:hypothetical protein
VIVGVEMWGVDPPERIGWDPLPDPPLDGGYPHSSLPGTAIKAETIHEIPLGTILDVWVQKHLNIADATKSWDEPGQADRVKRFKKEVGRKSTGRVPLEKNFLQFVADQYRLALSLGDRRPAEFVRAAAERERNRPASSSAARTWISRARKQGYLEPAARRAGR